MKRIVLALIAAVAVVASANFASARVAAPEMLVTGNNVERVLFGSKKYKASKFKQTKFKAPKFKYTKFKAPKFKYSKFKHKKFGHHKVKKPKGPSYGPKGHSATGLYVVGGVVCSAAFPIINAALDGPVPTSEEVLWNMAGCFIPPLGIYQFIQSISNP